MNAVANDLQAGFEILWYQIESVLGRGGFGITYLAKDNNLGQLVAIKEYLPHDFAARSGDSTVQPVSVEENDVYNWGLERFMTEAQTLAKFKHPNIVRVLSVFKQNNTGYMVMEYEQGEDLSNVYKRQKKLPQKQLEGIYYPIIDGLAAVHKEGFIHRDIKPSNIYIRTDGSPVLIDFGAARQAVGSKTKTLTSMLSIGYAPFEQYNDASGKQGPWTDIYALGASLHQGITGQKPMESTIRGMALLHDEPDPYEPLSRLKPEGYSPAFLRAIDQALMLQIHDRPQTLEDFLGMLKGDIALPDLPEIPEKVTDSTQVRERTVVRPKKREFSGHEVTHPDGPITKTEKLDSVAKSPPANAEAKAKSSAASSPATSKKGFFTLPKILIGSGAILGIVVIVLMLLPGEKTPEDINQQKIEALLKKAEEQIRAGIYFENSGQGALGAFQQILTIDANNADAKNGITNIGRLLLSETEQFIANKDFARADANLKLVNRINPNFPGLKDAQQRFAGNLDTEKKFKQIEILLSQARSALDQGNAYEPDQKNAYVYYQNVLKLDPENVTAKLGLYDIADKLINDAQTAIQQKNGQRAESLIVMAESINPDKPAIKNLREQIGQTNKLADILSKADQAFARSRYTSPQNDNAYDWYKQVLSLDSSNLQAQGRLNKIADYYADRTRNYTQSGNIASARQNLDTLAKYFPEYSGLSRLRSGISSKQKQIEAAKVTKKPATTTATTSSKLLPVGINQKQDDYQVVQDIVGLFINAFNSRDMGGLLNVSRLTSQQQALYTSIFKLYQSLSVKVVPNSFTLTKKDGLASVRFEITDLVDSKGHSVVTRANWTNIELKISKENGNWLKAEIL